MRAFVFAPIVLALGLAAYIVVTPGRDDAGRDAPQRDAPERESAVPGGARFAAPALEAPSAGVPAERAAETQVRSAEQLDEDLALALPPAADEIAESPAPQPIESPQERVERLIAAGFGAERAAAIVQQETQLRLAAAYTQFESSGTVRALNPATAGTVASALREELGDADYERYLGATGQPTRVVVGDVEPGSAAANAGFLPGDEIRAYRGRRVFNVHELNASMLDGDIGQTVPATVVRDGQALQLYVGGGELGIAARSVR